MGTCKMHEHMATTRHEGEFWKDSLMLFTESWLTVDTFIELDGSQERRKAIERGWGWGGGASLSRSSSAVKT